MSRPWVGRDSQRSRVYAAEQYACTNGTAWDNPDTWTYYDNLQSYVDSIVKSSWWRRTYLPPEDGPVLVRYGLAEPPTKVLVRPLSRHSRFSGFAPNTPVLYRGRYVPVVKFKQGWGYVPQWMVLHELCHQAAQHDPGHGRDFARVYLSAIKRFIGDEAAGLLRAGYREHGVKYTKINSQEKVA